MYDRESSKARNKECRDIPLKLDKMVHGQRKLGGINNRILSSDSDRRLSDECVTPFLGKFRVESLYLWHVQNSNNNKKVISAVCGAAE